MTHAPDGAPGLTTPETVHTPLPIDQAALALGAASALAKGMQTRYDEGRELINGPGYLSPGATVPIRHPRTGQKLGTVSVTDPTPVAEVYDEAQLLAHAAVTITDSDPIEDVEKIDPKRIDEALDVLREHRPELIATTPTLRPWARKQLLEQAVADPSTPIPGAVVATKPGHATVRHATGLDVLAVYQDLLEEGLVPRELPPAPPAAA